MAKLTPEQYARAKARGAKTEVVPKHVKVSEPLELSGIGELVDTLQRMAEGQQRAQMLIIESINNLVAATMEKGVESRDIEKLTRAVMALKQETVTESNTPLDYRVEFERDQRGLLKSGIMFTAVPKVLN